MVKLSVENACFTSFYTYLSDNAIETSISKMSLITFFISHPRKSTARFIVPEKKLNNNTITLFLLKIYSHLYY